MKAITVGMRVEAGERTDRDAGEVLRVEEEAVFVAWDVGVRTWCPIEDCVPVEEDE